MDRCSRSRLFETDDTHLDDPSDDELAALVAAGGEEDMEVVLAVLPPVILVEHTVREGSEALGTHEASGTVQFSIAVDNLRLGFEPILTASTGDTFEVHDARHDQADLSAEDDDEDDDVSVLIAGDHWTDWGVRLEQGGTVQLTAHLLTVHTAAHHVLQTEMIMR